MYRLLTANIFNANITIERVCRLQYLLLRVSDCLSKWSIAGAERMRAVSVYPCARGQRSGNSSTSRAAPGSFETFQSSALSLACGTGSNISPHKRGEPWETENKASPSGQQSVKATLSRVSLKKLTRRTRGSLHTSSRLMKPKNASSPMGKPLVNAKNALHRMSDRTRPRKGRRDATSVASSTPRETVGFRRFADNSHASVLIYARSFFYCNTQNSKSANRAFRRLFSYKNPRFKKIIFYAILRIIN